MNETSTVVLTLAEKARGNIRSKNPPKEVMEEILGLVTAALDDMERIGIDIERLCPESATASELRPLVVRAVMLYVKAYFGISRDANETSRYKDCYDSLTQSLSLTTGYRKDEKA